MNNDRIIKQTKLNYNRIASEFSSKREHLTDDILYLKKYINKDDSVLDLGCGNGRLIEMLQSSNKYLGIDNSKGLIKIAKKRYPNFKFQQRDILKLNLKKKFNTIYSLSVIHHFPKKYHQKFIQIIKKHLNKNGKTIITVWKLNQKQFKSGEKISKNEILIPFKNSKGKILAKRYIYLFKPQELKDLFKSNGFKIIKSGINQRGKSRNYYIVVKNSI